MLTYYVVIVDNDITTATFATVTKRAGQCFAEEENEAPFGHHKGPHGFLLFFHVL